MAKQVNDQAPAHTENEISALYGKVTDGVSVKVSMGPEGRKVVRQFLTGLDENLSIAEVKSALEADWS
ncbi:hypothetical protein [Acetobacter sp.]|uniref:hypothetical protein n=1 Tax=Acetobacter sp. TaxID=440 RepID=UPI0039EC61A8